MLRHQYFEKPSARRHRKKLNQRRRSQQLQGVVHAR
jgi:ribosomal protein S21